MGSRQDIHIQTACGGTNASVQAGRVEVTIVFRGGMEGKGGGDGLQVIPIDAFFWWCPAHIPLPHKHAHIILANQAL